MSWMVLLFLFLFLPAAAWGQAACTHWASPQGQGSACTKDQPCKVQSFWPLAQPGGTLCLKAGTYTGAESLILPPAGVKGTQSQPLTIRAEVDGKVLLDAQHASQAVWLSWHNGTGSNDWMRVEGLNVTNFVIAGFDISGSDNIVSRAIAYHGTSGDQNSFPFNVVGYRSRAVDCAAWGMNMRKVFNMSQGGDVQGAGYQRCWGEWNDHTQGESDPTTTAQIGYNTVNARWENMLLTWDTKGQTSNADGPVSLFNSNNTSPPPSAQRRTYMLGVLAYIRPGANFTPDTLAFAHNFNYAAVQDMAMIVPPGYPSKSPFWFMTCTQGWPECKESTCTNCLAVHDGTPGVNQQGSGWSFPGLRQGRGLQAATAGRSAFELLPGLCRRYEKGVLTDQPLWPWPMNDRIKEARIASGYGPTDVQAEVEQALGPIPAQCKAGGPPPADTTPPTVTITAPSHEALVSGTAVAVSASARDNVGVTAVRFYLDNVRVGSDACCEEVHVLADSTQVANGLHKFRAEAVDAAGNVGVSGTIDVTVFNSQPEPPAHLALHCTGELGAKGAIALDCATPARQR